jgi:hypothetical protein
MKKGSSRPLHSPISAPMASPILEVSHVNTEPTIELLAVYAESFVRATAAEKRPPSYSSVWNACVPLSTKQNCKRLILITDLPQIWARLRLAD